MSTLAAVQIVNGLLSLTINAIAAAQRYGALVEQARAEGRDITEAELAEMRAESHRLTQESDAALDGIE